MSYLTKEIPEKFDWLIIISLSISIIIFSTVITFIAYYNNEYPYIINNQIKQEQINTLQKQKELLQRH